MAERSSKPIWTTTAAADVRQIPYTRNRKHLDSYDSEFREEDFDETCCGGRMSIRTILPIVTFVALLLDGGCFLLTLSYRNIAHFFLLHALIYLLVLACVISGVQLERKNIIKIATVAAAMKAVSLIALEIAAIIILFDHTVIKGGLKLDTELWVLMAILPLIIATLITQWRLGVRLYELIKLRDELYIITSEVSNNQITPTQSA